MMLLQFQSISDIQAHRSDFVTKFPSIQVSAQLAAGRSQSPNVSAEERGDQKGAIDLAATSSDGMPGKVLPELNVSDITGAANSTPSPVTINIDDESALQRDWRSYHCKTWQLEPTVR
jgi:hypothetical protein